MGTPIAFFMLAKQGLFFILQAERKPHLGWEILLHRSFRRCKDIFENLKFRVSGIARHFKHCLGLFLHRSGIFKLAVCSRQALVG